VREKYTGQAPAFGGGRNPDGMDRRRKNRPRRTLRTSKSGGTAVEREIESRDERREASAWERRHAHRIRSGIKGGHVPTQNRCPYEEIKKPEKEKKKKQR